MLALLALSLALPVSTTEVPNRVEPAIQVRLSDDFYFRGERAKVRFKAERDGYLVVLRLDGEGRIRPLYPVDPSDSSFVRGGKDFEIRGRGDRDAFTVDERDGTGYVIAAISEAPFDLSQFTRGSHWDLRALSEATTGDDPEMTLLDVIDSLAAGHFEYDLASYTVGGNRRDHVYRTRPWFGRPLYYDPWYHGYDPFYGPGHRFSFGFSFGGYRGHRRWW
jgi:hypothetical protein